MFSFSRMKGYGVPPEEPSRSAHRSRKSGPRGEPRERKQVLPDRGPEFPRSEEEAYEHIAAIRAEKLSATGTSIARALNNVLKESAKLYSDSHHFLFELIQNADDNQYDDPIPTMGIFLEETRTTRILRIDCNEIGFSRANLEAICSLSESSKAQPDRKRKYIGEKGMGFKSVFAVADVVTVRSGYYSFKFVNNKSEPLAMIMPHWVEPSKTQSMANTSITLELSREFSTKKFVKKLKSMDPAFLIFLKNLQKIEIELNHEKETEGWVWKRSDFGPEVHGLATVTVHAGEESTEYAVLRSTVSDLPHDDRRTGVTKTGLTMVFPVRTSSEDIEDKVSSLYAYLPVRDYGFRFLINADFILVASREDLDPSPWNRHIIKQIPAAFLDAVKGFTESEGSIRYIWLRFVPLRKNRHEIFAKLHSKILDLLSEHQILESHAGDLVNPNRLTYVPEKFRNRNGSPLVPLENAEIMHISEKYHPDHEKAMKKLGVRRMSSTTFLHELSTYISRRFEEFVRQPQEWHARLAKVLSSLIHNDDSRRQDIVVLIRDLKIIPLRDGRRWTSANEGTILFPPDGKVMDVPNGIDIFVVHEDAYKQPERKQLLLLLDAKKYENFYVCEAIINAHDLEDFRPEEVSTDDLISHIKFLVAVDWTPAKSDQLDVWFVVEDGSCQPGSKVYIDSKVSYSATSIFRKQRSRFPFLHPKYSSELSKASQKWTDILCRYLMLEKVPRFVSPPWALQDGISYSISNDFRFIVEEKSPMDALLLLREHWGHYEKWIMPTKNSKSEPKEIVKSKTEVREYLSSMVVPCRGGKKARLDSTLLPRKNIYVANGYRIQNKNRSAPAKDQTLQDPRDYVKKMKGALQGVIGRSSSSDRFLRPPTDYDLHGSSRLLSRSSSPPRHRRHRSFPEAGNDGDNRNGGTDRNHQRTPSHASSSQKVDEVVEESNGNMVKHKSKKSRHRRKHSKARDESHVPGLDQEEDESWSPDERITGGRLFLNVPDPNDERWDFLGHFGVVVKMNAAAIIDRLRRLRDKGSVTKEEVSMLYEQIEISVAEIGADSLRSIFEKEELVFFPADGQFSRDAWVRIKDCVWDGPACLRHIRLLEPEYGARFILFCTILKCRKASLTDLISEAKKIGEDDSLQHIKQVFQEINSRVGSNSANEIKKLKEFQIFPTRKGNDSARSIRLQDADKEWYIPDIQDVATHFKDKRFLAFNYQTIKPLRPLFRLLGLEKKYLSQAAVRTTAPGKSFRQNQEYQLWLRDRIRYVKRLILPESDRDRKYALLRGIEIFTAKEIYTTWTMYNRNGEVDRQYTHTVKHGFVENERDGRLALYMLPEDSEPGDASIDLIVELSQYCGFNENGENAVLLSRILAERDTSNIERYLSRNGISFEPAGEDADTGDKSKTKSGSGMLHLPVHFRDIRDGRMNVRSPFVSFAKPDMTYTTYVGELYISKALERILGSDYNPNHHWLSPFRARNGHSPFEPQDKDGFTFKFIDKNAKFLTYLSDNGYESAELLSHLPIFHIHVSTSTGDINSIFEMSVDQVTQAKTFTVAGLGGQTASELLIAARVARVDQDPQVVFFPDPWQMFIKATMRLEPLGNYRASFRDGAPGIVVPAPGLSNEWDSIYHTPLNAATYIRLIELKGGKINDPLKADIHIVPITKPGRFWALSYAWGPPPSEQIPYYLETSHGRLLISASLNLALRKIRARRQSVRVWADAVCINQMNSHEKTLQIQLMGDIYHCSERVFAWLGPDEDNSERAMATLIHISDHGSDVSYKSEIRAAAKPIRELLNRPWFKRVWIVQELVRGSDVFIVCGDLELNWESFFNAVVDCERLINLSLKDGESGDFEECTGPTYALGRTRELLVFERRKLTLLELLEFFAYTGATREEDKLFALRGLAYDVSGDAFDPFYGDTVEVGIRKYAEAFVKEGRALDLLYRAGSTNKSYAFSTWIPRWTRGKVPRTIADWECNEPFYAGPRTPIKARLNEKYRRILEVDGYEVDRIISITAMDISSDSLFYHQVNFAKAMFAYRKLINSLGERYPTGETAEELQFRIPIGNARGPRRLKDEIEMKAFRLPGEDDQGDERSWPTNLPSDLFFIHEGQDQSLYDELPDATKEEILLYWESAAVFAERIPKAKFCVTEKGYAGLVPGESDIGDSICVFHGGRVPFVLRKPDFTQQNRYGVSVWNLLGECYIHGIMHGRALEGVNRMEVTTFGLM